MNDGKKRLNYSNRYSRSHEGWFPEENMTLRILQTQARPVVPAGWGRRKATFCSVTRMLRWGPVPRELGLVPGMTVWGRDNA